MSKMYKQIEEMNQKWDALIYQEMEKTKQMKQMKKKWNSLTYQQQEEWLIQYMSNNNTVEQINNNYNITFVRSLKRSREYSQIEDEDENAHPLKRVKYCL